ncbi:DUF4258 domain-containing protein (plasmid) [Microvirga terrae]|uniref:DUF4258 domain-containing protein n=1 Tax=Microvirga terrae TaxID=2740529 RepID=A0ABY5RZX2_9HYPH|nr:DUF4258 domain-containing protein [Microvirga terrae]UVF22790.1 DUF4258 domain-containing protein [Microvirga terrae]
MESIETATEEITMTRHARTRCQQRGIQTEVLRLVLEEGDREYHAGEGTFALSLSHHTLAQLSFSDIPKATLDQAANTVVLMADNGSVVTVVNHQTWTGRFYRGAKRHNPRRQRQGRYAKRYGGSAR